MKPTINAHEFIDAFRSYNRYDAFGYAALNALFEYLEEMEEGMGGEMELDVIAICCDYTQYDTATEAAVELLSDWETEEGETEEEREERALEELQENTTVIVYDGGIVVESF